MTSGSRAAILAPCASDPCSSCRRSPAWPSSPRAPCPAGEWRDTVGVRGAGTNRVYRLAWQGGMAWTLDSVSIADPSARLFPAGLTLVPRLGLVAVVGNMSDSVYFLDAATMARRGSL